MQGWPALQKQLRRSQCLLSQALLAKSLPPGVLHQSTAFLGLEESEGGGSVTLRFAGGHPPVRARLVVGADGCQSAVRQQIIGDGPPLFAGKPKGLQDREGASQACWQSCGGPPVPLPLLPLLWMRCGCCHNMPNADAAVWRAVMPKPEWWPKEPGSYVIFGGPPTVMGTQQLHTGDIAWQVGARAGEEGKDREISALLVACFSCTHRLPACVLPHNCWLCRRLPPGPRTGWRRLAGHRRPTSKTPWPRRRRARRASSGPWKFTATGARRWGGSTRGLAAGRVWSAAHAGSACC